MNVSIYGIGNFGYAFLKHLDQKNDGQFNLTAYDYNLDRIEFLKSNRSHPFLHANTKLSSNINFTNNLDELLDDCDIVLLAVPSTATRQAISEIKKRSKKNIIIVNTAKSLDKDTGNRLSQIVDEVMQGSHYEYALIAGGTIASDLFKHEPLGVDIACTNKNTLAILKNIFQSNNLTVYTTTDILGVEYAAAFKNVVSIFAGVVNGMGLSYGAETHIISKISQLIADACVDHLGAQRDTFAMGRQCWGNDMWMSCTGNTRNREFGVLIGSGLTVDAALKRMSNENKLVEGINTLNIVDNIPGICEIEPIRLLKQTVVDQTHKVEVIKNYILNKPHIDKT